MLASTNGADGSSVFRVVGKRVPMVQANQLTLVAANATPTQSRPNNMLLHARGLMLAQAVFELDLVEREPHFL